MDSNESMPFSAWLSTGTPSTGSSVLAATIPGRCAAPPAPAMITCNPRASAPDAYSTIQAGVRCAETTLASCGTPKRVNVSPAARIVSQSDWLPMMMPTSGCIQLLSLRKLAAGGAVRDLGADSVAMGDRNRDVDGHIGNPPK